MTKHNSRSYAKRRDKARGFFPGEAGGCQAPGTLTDSNEPSVPLSHLSHRPGFSNPPQKHFYSSRKPEVSMGGNPNPNWKYSRPKYAIPVNKGKRNNRRFDRRRGKNSFLGSSQGHPGAASLNGQRRHPNNAAHKNRRKRHRVRNATVEKALEEYGNERTTTVAYTDGACSLNGKYNAVAGIGVWWGAGNEQNISERCPGLQTNNRAELFAVVRLLEETPMTGEKGRLIIRTDSKYTINCVMNWAPKWEAQGWMTAAGGKVQNAGMIKYLLALLSLRATHREIIVLEHVRGHCGSVGNEAADALARRGTTQPIIPERNWYAGQERVEAAIQNKLRSSMTFSRPKIQDQMQFVVKENDFLRFEELETLALTQNF